MILGVPRAASAKVVDRDEAARLAALWTSQDRTVVFTNGCFDLIHAGHVRYLAAARALGHALIVGLNSDASIRRLKGSRRPILPEPERAEIIASLECVDLVVRFDEDDPGALIDAVRPRVLVKGADWSKEKVIGRETVERLGGRVLTIPLVDGRSTSNIIKTVLERYTDIAQSI